MHSLSATPSPATAQVMPPSVNFHLWEPCNMRCRFCFATFQDVRKDVLPKGHLPKQEALKLVELLALRFQKITFAGGEPLLCPWLPELVAAAKARGATTMLVTNGSRLDADTLAHLHGVMDWVTLSIDSMSPQTHAALGRAVHGKALPVEHYLTLAERIRAAGMRLKVNTVVTNLNAGEDQTAFLRELRPERWKLLRVLSVEGQNTGKVEPLFCPREDFEAFVARHRGLERDGIVLVPEDNEDMRGSYAMVDPAGRFFDNVQGGHRYSAPILQHGLDAAWSQVHFSIDRFVGRDGFYAFGGES
ncbi:viperin family antiviral radical SAM protein [Corallococcus sp. AS-1-12]|uniref:viperin family antiviral radical SAM protein n=1 Tax=Corallococcus sp. AS-1-12 TaxID=2874598 RepID=UPI001CBF36F5|nr:viperin family antiviral radical SAM protein [Corallococcus sp. AS-1-12]MBZ4331490.1 viperin family antiviral radical SAM protein [Corallococcus sp. AS-1-12]